MAPINTEKGLINFIGVYTAAYKNREMDAKIATFKFIRYIKKIPNSEHIIAMNNAKLCEILTELLKLDLLDGPTGRINEIERV